jgi:beta-N-acetylhexosaminidase
VLLCNQSVGDEGRAVDELLDGLAQAQRQGQFRPSEASEQRRLDLLPQTPPMAWDDLMVQPQYMQAMALLP